MKTLTFLLLAAAVAAAGDTREDAARKLDTRISLDLKDVKLGDAIQIFRDLTGLNFVVAEGSELLVRLTVRDVSAKGALRLLLQPAGLGAGFEHGVVVIRNREALASTMTLRIYDVRSTLRKVQDFPAPRIGVVRQALLCSICFLGPCGGLGDSEVCVFLEDFLVMLVRENTGERSWDQDPRASIQLIDGRLQVLQTPRVHREIENLLRQICFQ